MPVVLSAEGDKVTRDETEHPLPAEPRPCRFWYNTPHTGVPMENAG